MGVFCLVTTRGRVQLVTARGREDLAVTRPGSDSTVETTPLLCEIYGMMIPAWLMFLLISALHSLDVNNVGHICLLLFEKVL